MIAATVFHVYQFSNTDRSLFAGTAAFPVLNSLDAAVSWLIVITAFLVFEPVIGSVINRGPPIAAGRLLRAGAVRLLPVYYVTVVVVWLPRQASLPGEWRDLFEHLTFTQVFDSSRIFWTIGPAWALSAALWSALVFLGIASATARLVPSSMSRRQVVGVLAAVIGALAVGSLAWKAWAFVAFGSTQVPFAIWFGPAAVLDNVAVGVGVAVAVVALRPRGPLNVRRRAGLYGVALATLTLAFAVREPDRWTGVFFPSLCAAGFGCMVAATALGPLASRPQVPDVPPSTAGRAGQWLGGVALSTYLWHEPVMLVLHPLGLIRQAPNDFAWDAVVVVAASLLIGWISVVTIERPTLRLANASQTDHAPPPRNRHSPGGQPCRADS